MIAQLKKLRKWTRSRVGKARLKRLGRVSPCRIIIGTSGVRQNSWIPTDMEYLNLLNPTDWSAFFEPGSIDAILAEHVWEHLTEADALKAAENCFHYLKPGGYLRLAVPDGFHPDPVYIEATRPGGSGLGSDDHKVHYNYQSLSELLKKAGFTIEFLEYFDESGEFHFQDWDRNAGMVWRSKRFDERNQKGKLNYTSVILDARKGLPSNQDM
jgi:predicted SAM-dependent methyltransferase